MPRRVEPRGSGSLRAGAGRGRRRFDRRAATADRRRTVPAVVVPAPHGVAVAAPPTGCMAACHAPGGRGRRACHAGRPDPPRRSPAALAVVSSTVMSVHACERSKAVPPAARRESRCPSSRSGSPVPITAPAVVAVDGATPGAAGVLRAVGRFAVRAAARVPGDGSPAVDRRACGGRGGGCASTRPLPDSLAAHRGRSSRAIGLGARSRCQVVHRRSASRRST